MRTLSTSDMNAVQGGGWFSAFACGMFIVADLAAIAFPRPAEQVRPHRHFISCP